VPEHAAQQVTRRVLGRPGEELARQRRRRHAGRRQAWRQRAGRR
jgi:hypothetical protein